MKTVATPQEVLAKTYLNISDIQTTGYDQRTSKSLIQAS